MKRALFFRAFSDRIWKEGSRLPILALALFLGATPQFLWARTLQVAQDGSGEFAEIWLAVEAAVDGDTVYVAPGDYNTAIVIRRSIALKGAGADRTRIVAPLTAVAIGAEGVTIEGFTIAANVSARSLVPAIVFGNMSPKIHHNIVLGGHVGIECSGNANPIIQYNDLARNTFGIGLIDNPNTIDARFNWWGTVEEAQIAARIMDARHPEGSGEVLFEPWLTSPQGIYPSDPTLVSFIGWGYLKMRTVGKEKEQ